VSLQNAQALRRLGLALEAVAMLAMIGTNRGQIDFWDRIGIDAGKALPVVFAIGFALWITGTLTVRKLKRQADR
jgi:hypothetical protein